MANRTDSTDVTDSTFIDDWRRWRTAREAALTAAYGPLSPVGMGWLGPGSATVDGAPGRWSRTADTVRLELTGSENPRHDGRELNPGLGCVTVDLPVPDATGYVVEDGETRVEVVRRGDRTLVRPRHPGNAAALGYETTPTFAPDPAWVVPAEFHRYTRPQVVTVGAVTPGLTHRFAAVGDLVFTRDGREHTLQAFATGEEGLVQVIFTDATAGRTTWRDNRQVNATLRGVGTGGAEATIDFNRAVNFPGAYTAHATCPLPPEGNRLDLEITAGEQTPEHRN